MTLIAKHEPAICFLRPPPSLKVLELYRTNGPLREPNERSDGHPQDKKIMYVTINQPFVLRLGVGGWMFDRERRSSSEVEQATVGATATSTPPLGCSFDLGFCR